MALSDHEQRMLDQIESALYEEDPSFSTTMSGRAERSSDSTVGINVSIQSVAISVLGLVMLLGGVALAQVQLWFIILSVVGFIVMFAGGVMALTGTGGSGRNKSQRGKGKSPKKSPKLDRGSGNSGEGGLENRFRSRFEGP